MRRLILLLLILPALGGCAGSQSAFMPRGAEAERIDTLFWVMTIGGGIIFVGVIAITAVAMLGGARVRRALSSEPFINGAGIAFPSVVLTVLLVYGLLILGAGARTPPAGDGLRIAVSGELWWWRVTYTDAEGNTFDTANELHLPVGEPVAVELTSADVIHSFWAPNLAGKLDMIPGRTNTLTLTATQPGVTRGQCAEYCGGAHAFMSFHVVAQPREEFDAWMRQEAGPAVPPASEAAERGAALFLSAGCGACHAVRGTEATGTIGPDLTHIGARRSIGAGMLPNDAAAMRQWIVDNQHIKPENKMPAYEIFTEAELDDLSAYLEGLK
nr:cytochrome c oxidase subunit II [Devosia geojensis]